MTCPAEALRDRRVIYALRPSPIAAHKIAPTSYRLFGLHEAVWFTAAAMAGACWLALLIGGNS
jgi:hypothetical protein